jgi:hypothetical protein
LSFNNNLDDERSFILSSTAEQDPEDDLDDEYDWNPEAEEEQYLPADRPSDGEFDYTNDDGIVVPKDSIY